ncbi:MAG: UDP-3-O-acyl-N-acetylglucosamine deacetylase [Bacteroidales bacterium]|nr:UDP-3-O-acyl-N-acetylglucosamine deacetylase [Bacteroidales bacterium]
MKQTTLAKPTTPLSSTGLHTGHMAQATLLPASANTGIVLRRTDLFPPVDIPVLADNVGDTARNTTLQKNGASVATVEHILSALNGMQVDNAIVEVNGPEAPILDGSAALWTQAISHAGIIELDEERRCLMLPANIYMTGDREGVEYIALPSNEFRVTAIIDFNSHVIGKQVAEFRRSQNDYAVELAPCRTFVFLHEIMPLLEAGLIKGGDLTNAIIVVDPPLDSDKTERLAQLVGRHAADLKVEKGILNTSPHRFNNELARHKLLDFLGDILLAGHPINAHFIIRCPGHKNNATFAALLRKTLQLKQK